MIISLKLNNFLVYERGCGKISLFTNKETGINRAPDQTTLSLLAIKNSKTVSTRRTTTA